VKNSKLYALAGMAVVVAFITYGAIQGYNRDSQMAASEPMEQGNSALMQKARQAFWARDLVTAENSYRQLIESGQGNADTWGELGNVYYMQAKWPQTAEAYTEAALLLVDARAVPQAMHMHAVVMRMDMQQAKRIDEKLQSHFADMQNQ